MEFLEARVGGRSVGVPGTPRLLEIAHARHGRLAWKTLFEPAIELAEKGFPVSPRLHRLIGDDRGLAGDPAARAYFFDARGEPKAVGTIVLNPQFPATCRAIAAQGAYAFYVVVIPPDIVPSAPGPANPLYLCLHALSHYPV